MVEQRASDFGGRMRRLREQRGVTLREIAATTKISIAQLEALERNDVRRLPGGIFRRAVVRAYAEQIGADPDATLRDFMANAGGESAMAGDVPVSPTDYEKATTPRRNPRPLLAGALILVIAVLVIWSLVALA